MEDSDLLSYIAERAGVETIPANEASSQSVDAGLIIRGKRAADDLKNLSIVGLPIVVVAGKKDELGLALAKEAERYGVPAECVLYVEPEKGSIVNGLGVVIDSALRGTGLSVKTAISAVRDAVEHNLIPERPLWDAAEEKAKEEQEERSLYDAVDTSLLDLVPADAEEAAAKEPEEEPKQKPTDTSVEFFSPTNNFWTEHLDKARKKVAVIGIKNGVGNSTTAACLAGVLQDRESVYLEISNSPSGYLYFGKSVKDATNNGRYIFCSQAETSAAPKETNLLIVDASIPEALDDLYAKADCIVIVTDGSPASFERFGRWVKGGCRADIVVVSKAATGASYPPEVYQGEFGLDCVIGIPGGTEEEMAINLAQRNNSLPLGRSVDLDSAVNEIAEAVLAKLGEI